ncbi:MAG: adenosylcobinamide amidohydrolase [Thermoprotei archaeon]|nr:adenosylcobinamide amidohydrolase [Thermoprotei archaeon]
MKLVNSIYYDEAFEALVVRLSEDHVFLTSLPHQPKTADSIVFKKVSGDFQCCSGGGLSDYYSKLRGSMGLERAIVFLTAANVKKHLYRELPDGSTIVATVGLEPPVCPGGGAGGSNSTVNIAVLVNVALSESGLVDILRTVVEAKSLAMAELLLRCKFRSPGTASDAIAVGRPAALEGLEHFAGMATETGNLIASEVYRGLTSFGLELLGLEGYVYNLLGLTLEELLDVTVKVYEKAPIPGLDSERARGRLKTLITGFLKDPNVLSLIIAARELDLRASIGSISGFTVEDYEGDSVKIVADELLASALALYISGFKGLLAAYWVERLKEKGLLNLKLPVFEDDILSALVGSAITRLCEDSGS